MVKCLFRRKTACSSYLELGLGILIDQKFSRLLKPLESTCFVSTQRHNWLCQLLRFKRVMTSCYDSCLITSSYLHSLPAQVDNWDYFGSLYSKNFLCYFCPNNSLIMTAKGANALKNLMSFGNPLQVLNLPLDIATGRTDERLAIFPSSLQCQC